MPNLRRVSGRRLLAALQKSGFDVVRIRGSHYILRKPGTGQVVVPVHGSDDLPTGTLTAILKQAAWSAKDLEKALNR